MSRRTVLARATFPLALTLAAAATSCSDGGGDRDAYCATAERFAVDNPAAAFARYDPTEPEAAAATLRDAADRLTAWADEAPGEVRDDVEALADAAATLATAFEEPGAETTEDVDTAAIEAASADVLQFTRDECGVDLGTTAAP